VPEATYHVALDRAKLLHPGQQVTVAAFSYMALEALLAARALASDGVSVEVIDMRSARPLDVDTVLASVKKTGRLLVADTAGRTGGVGAELVSQVVERGFGCLRAAPVRISCPDHPAPSSPFMAETYYPTALTLAQAALTLADPTPDPALTARLHLALARTGAHDTPYHNFCGPF
jgi:pyruvate dehydrogenase E1 component beta subunit